MLRDSFFLLPSLRTNAFLNQDRQRNSFVFVRALANEQCASPVGQILGYSLARIATTFGGFSIYSELAINNVSSFTGNVVAVFLPSIVAPPGASLVVSVESMDSGDSLSNLNANVDAMMV